MAFLDDRTADFDALAAKVLAINPRYGEVYRVAGAEAARHYRFDAAVELTRKALALDPGNVRASAELGAHLLRTGDEPSARASLDRAFKADPYDVVSYNLLGLLDSLDSFQTLQDGLVTMRLHPDEASVLKEHALPLARDALATLGARYHVDAARPDSDRDLPASRRLRRAQRRPARHDWCARRVLRPRGHARLAARPAARHVQLAGDALARAGARHHAPAVRQPHSAMAHRRHLRLRRAACAAGLVAGHGSGVRRGAGARRGAAPADAERRLHGPVDDLRWRTTRRRSSSSSSSTPTGSPRSSRSSAATPMARTPTPP